MSILEEDIVQLMRVVVCFISLVGLSERLAIQFYNVIGLKKTVLCDILHHLGRLQTVKHPTNYDVVCSNPLRRLSKSL